MLNRWPDIWDDDTFDQNNSHLNVYEDKNKVVVEANVAGVADEDVDLTFEKGVLWIQAKKQEEESDDERKYYSRSSFSYSYKVAVPGDVDISKEPEAEIKNGVLKVEFQKSALTQPKKLKIKSGK
jgi:HSP20 family protein